jgi:hypothetical protein
VTILLADATHKFERVDPPPGGDELDRKGRLVPEEKTMNSVDRNDSMEPDAIPEMPRACGRQNQPGGSRSGAGRKPIEMDLAELEKLCALQCTDEELAAWFGVSVRTIANRRKDPEIAKVMKRGRAKGRISVRRAQMKLLEAGNGTMGVWLGKQLLGQRDVFPMEVSGPNGQPLQVSLEALDAVIKSVRKRQATTTSH